MKDFYINSTSQDEIILDYYDYSNTTSDYNDYTYHDYYLWYNHYVKVTSIMHVVKCTIIGISLPLTLLAIYAVYIQVRKDYVVPIYVINLLISDLIQLCCMIVQVTKHMDWKILRIVNYFYDFSLGASVGFMVCIALERYLVIACPLWYRFRRTIMITVVICVMVWALPLVFLLTFYFWITYTDLNILLAVYLLLPLPLFIFFLGSTLKALSASSVPSDEKRRIVGILVLVLLIYTLLFLPRVISFLTDRDIIFISLSFMCLELSPLADLALYVFIRKGVIDKLLASLCCCRMDSNDVSISAV
ncbi:G-protein coupled receptor 4-like [Pempheris klunzingeri]|uniref:G-protein coupled receptor 4-like n=1 Tax=Pempheris klunzingeri TaxID=3127111 RepID=UPI00398006D9